MSMAACSLSFPPPNHPLLLLPQSSRHFSLPSPIRATSAVAIETAESTPVKPAVHEDILACPICFKPLTRRGPPGLNLEAIYRSGFKCETCNKPYSSKNMYLDLTVSAGTQEYSESKPAGTELFRSPFVSFLYERGWRQNFNRSGFPGPEEEFKMAQEYFKPAEGGILVDVSCGSGLFSRKFAKSGAYSGVIALDFSENMLRQCYEFMKMEDPTLSNKLALVRADVSRLPFLSASVDAVHAGAALHCWPSPSNAVAEITRILRCGGVFVGTTFLRYTSSTPVILRPLREFSLGSLFSVLFHLLLQHRCTLLRHYHHCSTDSLYAATASPLTLSPVGTSPAATTLPLSGRIADRPVPCRWLEGELGDVVGG